MEASTSKIGIMIGVATIIIGSILNGNIRVSHILIRILKVDHKIKIGGGSGTESSHGERRKGIGKMVNGYL